MERNALKLIGSIIVVLVIVFSLALIDKLIESIKDGYSSLKDMENDIEKIETKLYWLECKEKHLEELEFRKGDDDMVIIDLSQLNKVRGQKWRAVNKFKDDRLEAIYLETCLDNNHD